MKSEKKRKNMYNYEEIKDFVLGFGTNKSSTTEKERVLVDILSQLGYTEKGCGCKSQLPRLYQKLSTWLKNHPNGLCHYRIESGVLLFLDGKPITNAILTDELATLLLADDSKAKHIRQILPFEKDMETLSDEELRVISSTAKSVTKKENKRRVKK